VAGAGRAEAAIALVQHASSDAGTTTSAALAFPSANTGGNFIAVVIRAGKVGQVFTVSDSRGDVYRRALQVSATLDTVTLGIFYAEGIAGGANTVTVADTVSGGTLRFAVLEYSGVATSASLDGTPGLAEGTGTAMGSPSTTTTAAGDLILGLLDAADGETFTAGTGFTIEERVPASGVKLAVEDRVQASAGAIAASATISAAQPWAAGVAAFRAASAGPPPPADLVLMKSHAGSFTQGQGGAAYTLTVTNSGGTATSGAVTVTDTLPGGLTAATLSGTGWSCTLVPLSCNRSDALGAGASYPALTLTVNVSPSAPASVVNQASVAGGGETNTANDGASDTTIINPPSTAITLVQHTSRDAGVTTSSALPFTSSNTPGNWIAVAIRAGNVGQSFTVSDALGNVYRRALQVNGTLDTVTIGLFYAESIAGGANTVTVSDTVAGGTLRFAILEYSGVAGSGSLDGTPGLAEGTGTAATSPTTNASAGDLVLGMLVSSDASTMTAGAGFTIEERIPGGSSAKLGVEDTTAASAGPVAATGSISPGQAWAAGVAAFRAAGAGPPTPPDLAIAKTHSGSFLPGLSGATYTLTVTNVGGTATSGAVTVTDTLPNGLTATAFSGTGWTCTVNPLSCNRSDALAAGAGYPQLTLTVNVATSAQGPVTNSATVAGGGETNTANDTANDPTAIGSNPSVVGQWSAVQSWPIVAVHAHLLPDGDVLAWTDYTDNGGAQIWHRASNTFEAVNYSAVSLFCAGHAYLGDGRLLVAGGIVGLQDDLGPHDSTFFDGSSESWSAGPLMAAGRYYPTTTTLPDGRVIVNGGTTTCNTCVADLPEIFDPTTNAWTPMAASARMSFKYYPHTYVLPDGRILAAAQDDTAVITQALDLNTQAWTTIDPRIIDGHSSVMYLPGKIMKAGKATVDDPGHPALATTFVLDMTQPSPAWQATASMAYPRSYLNLTVLPDGQVVATGGGMVTDKADFTNAVYAAEIWNPTSKAWTTMSSEQIPRLYHSTALLLPDATVLVAGGGRENGRSQPDPKDEPNAEIFSPPYLFKGARPTITAAPAVIQYGTAFTVTTPDAARIGTVSLIALGSVTHSFNQNQRFVPLTFEASAGSLNVHPPADGNTAPPGNYMLFLVDTTGVPSTAAMVRVRRPSSGPITLVQHASKDAGTTTSTTLAFPSANTAGNWIAVVIRAGKAGQNFVVSDSRGNAYQKALQVSTTLDTVTLGVFYAESIAGGANTVTVSDSMSGGTLRIAVLEYSGIAASGSLDGTPVMAEGTGTALASPATTTSVAGDLILGLLDTTDGATMTAGAGFTIEERVPASPATKLAVEDEVQPAAGSIAATATIAPGQAWAAAVVAFKPGSAPPPPPNPPKLIITQPTEGSTVYGSVVNVTYTTSGDLTGVDHVDFQMDSDPVVMDLSFDGVYPYAGVHVGPNTLNGWLVRADNSKIAGSDATPVHFNVAVDPSDPVPPTVSITFPANGATVSSGVTVTANAADNVGVYGVQFKLDGAALGAEDLVAPYSTDWNTATAQNGAHVLTAVARDVAGNETTSAQVSVTVANAGPNDPSVIGQWAGPYNWPLVAIHAILLPTGKVLLIDDHATATGVQLWDPIADTLTSKPYNTVNLFCSGHTLLPDGRVLVVGGHTAAYVGIPDATIFDPVSESWSPAATMSYARWYPTATSLSDGRVITFSGAISCPTCADPAGSHDGIALLPEIYDPKTNTWSQLANASLSLPLYPHIFALPDGRLFASASQEDPIVSQALDLNTQTWTVVDPVARAGGSSVMYAPGKILKTGMGRNPDYTPIPSAPTAYVIDMNLPSPSWRAVASMSFSRTQHNLTMLPDGNVLAVGGSTDSDVNNTPGTVKTAELWSPAMETWSTLATMQEPRHYHSTSLLLPDGRVMVAGGGRFGPDFPNAEIFSPPYLFKGVRPVISSAPSLVPYNSHFTVTTPDGARIAKVALIRLGAVTHAFDEDQRYVELPFTTIPGGLDVTGPAGPSIVLPGYDMLFIVDTSGVPSVAAMVRFPAPWEDTVPPSAPTNLAASTTPGRINLTWTAATDNTGVALYNVHRGTLPGVVPSAANRIGQSLGNTYADTGFASGTYYYVVTAQDAGGNVGPPSNEASIFAQADSTPPSVSVTSPAAGATVSGVVTVTATASDDVGVAGVQFLLDGAVLGPEDLAAPYSTSWNTSLSTNGAHTLTARARDAFGNTTTSAPVGVTVSNTASQGLVLAYSFDDGAGGSIHDSSANGNNGAIHGATWSSAGHTASALSFEPQAYADSPNTPSLDIGGHGLTIEMWAFINPGTNDDYVLLEKPWAATGQTYPYYQYGIEYDWFGNKTLDFYFADTTGQSVGPVSMAAPTGSWVHLAFTYDGANVKGYLNGTLQITKAATTDIQPRGNPLRLGVDGSLQQGYNGKLDDLRIYNRALSPTEIQQDMNLAVPYP
jgi:uncharacterized repeat protein (TIGR01451 family)